MPASPSDFRDNAQRVAAGFAGQRQRARDIGVQQGRVTIFVDRVSHNFPVGTITVAQMRLLLRATQLFSDGRSLADGDIVSLAAGDDFWTRQQE